MRVPTNQTSVVADVKFYRCDITSALAIQEAADWIRSDLGTPSILVNNAGIASAHTILDTSDEWLHKIFDVNLLSNFTTVKAFIPGMIAKNKESVPRRVLEKARLVLKYATLQKLTLGEL